MVYTQIATRTIRNVKIYVEPFATSESKSLHGWILVSYTIGYQSDRCIHQQTLLSAIDSNTWDFCFNVAAVVARPLQQNLTRKKARTASGAKDDNDRPRTIVPVLWRLIWPANLFNDTTWADVICIGSHQAIGCATVGARTISCHVQLGFKANLGLLFHLSHCIRLIQVLKLTGFYD